MHFFKFLVWVDVRELIWLLYNLWKLAISLFLFSNWSKCLLWTTWSLASLKRKESQWTKKKPLQDNEKVLILTLIFTFAKDIGLPRNWVEKGNPFWHDLQQTLGLLWMFGYIFSFLLGQNSSPSMLHCQQNSTWTHFQVSRFVLSLFWWISSYDQPTLNEHFE